MGVSVFRRVQDGHHGEPAITRERKHFSKIHESDCKPSTCLACSYLNWREEVSAALCSAVNRTNERTNDKTTTVPRVNNVSVAFAMVTSLKLSLFSVHGPVHSPVHGPVHESRVQVLYHPHQKCHDHTS